MVIDDEGFGYLRAKVDNLEKDLNNHILWGEAYHEELTEKLDAIISELSVAKTFLKIVKAIGWSFIFILAFKFGDIKGLWGGITK